MIHLYVKNEAELYNRFDSTRTRMNGEVYSYIKTCFAEIPLMERGNTVIQIQSDEPVEPQKLKELLHAAVERELVSMELKLKVNRIKMWRLYIIGIALTVLGIVLALSLGQIILEVISIIGSMAIKDAATIQIEHNPDIRVAKRLLEQLKSAAVQ